jgi:hypothetical protein
MKPTTPICYKGQLNLWALACCLMPGLLFSPGILAQQADAPWKAVVDAGSPTIRYGFKDYAGGYEYYEVRFVTYTNESALRFYVYTPKMGSEGVDGFLYISPTRIVFDPTPKFKKHAFQFPKAEIKSSLQAQGQILALSLPGGRTIPFSPWLSQDPTKSVRVGAHDMAQSATVTWMTSALSDFAKTRQEFVEKTSGVFLYPEVVEKFKAEAAAWRALAVKPSMPDHAREHKVLAENAVREKNLTRARDEYEAALQIFPTWPEGQFNLALICGEAVDYGCAVEHMGNYLELVPDAPDAQGARDKLIIWRDKLQHPAQ